MKRLLFLYALLFAEGIGLIFNLGVSNAGKAYGIDSSIYTNANVILIAAFICTLLATLMSIRLSSAADLSQLRPTRQSSISWSYFDLLQHGNSREQILKKLHQKGYTTSEINQFLNNHAK